MTLHASKGREFDVVLVAGAEPGLLPLTLADLASDEAEERRLLYVGMTRARRLLVLLYARRRALFGRTLAGGLSPLLARIPREDVVERPPASVLPKRARRRA